MRSALFEVFTNILGPDALISIDNACEYVTIAYRGNDEGSTEYTVAEVLIMCGEMERDRMGDA